jgi:hypothetical protein
MRFLSSLALAFFLMINPSTQAKRVAYVGQVVDLHPLILKEEPFTLVSPAGSYQKIYEVRLSSQKYQCLYYKVPLNENASGELYSHTSKTKCQLAQVLKEGVKTGKLGSARIFDIDLKEKMTFKLHIKVGEKETVTTYFLPFLSKEKSYWSGLFPVYKSEKKKVTPFISFKEGDLCHQGCGELSYKCIQCPEAQWTQTLNLKCASRVSGICGDSLCGGRGQAACVRMTALKQVLDCEEAKEFVYCTYGREVECQSDGQITCR